MIHTGAGAAHQHTNRELAHVRDGLSIVTGMTMDPPATPPKTPTTRARKIAAIHAFADFLAQEENAYLPVPQDVFAIVTLGRKAEVDESLRMQTFELIADRFGGDICRTLHMNQLTQHITSAEVQGISIHYQITAYRDSTYKDH